MLDPSIVQGLQHALSPPNLDPPAIYRELTNGAAFRVERILSFWMSEQEGRMRAWRTDTRALINQLDLRDNHWSPAELVDLDAVVVEGAANIERSRVWGEDFAQKAADLQRHLKRVDVASARVHQTFKDRFTAMHRDKIRVLGELLDAVRQLRARVDIRSGASSGFVHTPWAPNGTTVAAMQEARGGRGLRRVTSIADLMSALDAEGD